MSIVTEQVGKNLDMTVNKPLKTLVYEAFKKTIILGEIPAGERINEKEFAEKMNISRTPVRFALKKLTEEQLVEHEPGIGVIVKGISVKDAYEIYDIRIALDTLATLKATELMNLQDFQGLEAIVEEGKLLNEAGKVREVLQNFSDFNTYIYDQAQMLRLKSIVANLEAYLVYFRDIAIGAKERRDVALQEHEALVESMKNRETDKIPLIIKEHLNHSLHFIVKEMQKHKIE